MARTRFRRAALIAFHFLAVGAASAQPGQEEGIRDRILVVLNGEAPADEYGGGGEEANSALGRYVARELEQREREVQAAKQWCANRVAISEHLSAGAARSILSAALLNSDTEQGVRVLSVLERMGTPVSNEDALRRKQCASLLYYALPD